MFKPHIGNCTNCLRESVMIVVKKGLCCRCNNEKKGKKPAKRAPRKATGELQVFMEIWKERPHFSEVSGRPLLPLGHPEWIRQFSHILSKGAFPSFIPCGMTCGVEGTGV